jgi:hypothetical protein
MPIIIKEDRSIVVSLAHGSVDVDATIALTAAERAQLLAIGTKLRDAARALVRAALLQKVAETDGGG